MIIYGKNMIHMVNMVNMVDMVLIDMDMVVVNMIMVIDYMDFCQGLVNVLLEHHPTIGDIITKNNT